MPYLTSLETKKSIGKKIYEVTAPLIYDDKKHGLFETPVGTLTDLSSVPRLAYTLVSEIVDQGEPGATHDDNYKRNPKGLTRAQADRVFYRGMRDVGINWAQANMGWLAVRLGAGDIWDEYRELEQLETK